MGALFVDGMEIDQGKTGHVTADSQPVSSKRVSGKTCVTSTGV
jgi:hypothetical protein